MASSFTHDADTNYLVRQYMNTGYQAFSLITPPLYTALIIARRGRAAWSINRFLRATWLGGVAGIGIGGGLAYGRFKYSNAELVRQRRVEVSYDTNRIRATDHATIGAVIMSLLTPAIFWKRANIVNLILGGAGLGSAFGTLTHYVRTLTGDPPEKVKVVVLEEKEETR